MENKTTQTTTKVQQLKQEIRKLETRFSEEKQVEKIIIDKIKDELFFNTSKIYFSLMGTLEIEFYSKEQERKIIVEFNEDRTYKIETQYHDKTDYKKYKKFIDLQAKLFANCENFYYLFENMKNIDILETEIIRNIFKLKDELKQLQK